MKISKNPLYFSGLFLNTLFLLLIFSLGFLKPFKVVFGQRIPLTDFLFLLLASIWMIFLILKHTAFEWHKVYLFLLFYLARFFTDIF